MSAVLPHAWCYACKGLRQFRLPLPAVKTLTIPLTPTAGARANPAWRTRWPAHTPTMLITTRTGVCVDCGAEISRGGGGRRPRATPAPDLDDLFSAEDGPQ